MAKDKFVLLILRSEQNPLSKDLLDHVVGVEAQMLVPADQAALPPPAPALALPAPVAAAPEEPDDEGPDENEPDEKDAPDQKTDDVPAVAPADTPKAA